MNARDVIEQVEKDAAEWLEMSTNPDSMMVGILAQQVVSLKEYIEYLEKRLKHECANVR